MGAWQGWGDHFWKHRTSRGQNGGTQYKYFYNVWLNIFSKSLYEKSNIFHPLLNIYFRAFSDLLRCGLLGPPFLPPPPVNKGLKLID